MSLNSAPVCPPKWKGITLPWWVVAFALLRVFEVALVRAPGVPSANAVAQASTIRKLDSISASFARHGVFDTGPRGCSQLEHIEHSDVDWAFVSPRRAVVAIAPSRIASVSIVEFIVVAPNVEYDQFATSFAGVRWKGCFGNVGARRRITPAGKSSEQSPVRVWAALGESPVDVATLCRSAGDNFARPTDGGATWN